MKINTVNVPAAEGKDAHVRHDYVEKYKDDYTTNDYKVANLDGLARHIMQSTVSDAYLPRIRKCAKTKEMLDTLALMSQGTEKIKENKLAVLMGEFESLTMKPSESIDAFELRITNIISTLASLGKELTNKEVNLKIVIALTIKWQTMKELYLATKDLLKFSSEILFSELKAHEFDLNQMSIDDEDEAPTPSKGVAFKSAKTDETEASIEELNPDLQLKGPMTRSRAQKLQGYLQCYLQHKLEDDGVGFCQYKLVNLSSIEDGDSEAHQG